MMEPKTTKEIMREAISTMEFDKEYLINDLHHMYVQYVKENNIGHVSSISPYLTQLVREGYLERIKMGVYKRIK